MASTLLLSASLALLSLSSSSTVLAQNSPVACAPVPAGLSNLASQFPPTGRVAQLLPNDDEANALYQQMLKQPSLQALLKVAPKGTNDGDFSKVKYDASDPDCWWSWGQCKQPKAPGLADDIFTCNEPSTWGLTFDDGPYCGQGRLLDFLDKNKQSATFFLIGANVLNQGPAEAQDIFERGHEVCGHTWSHKYMTSLTNEQAFAELYYTKKIIKEVVGVTTRCWRAPYGDVDDRIRGIAAFLDSRTVLWDNDTDDWEIDSGTPASTIQANFAKIIAQANTGHGTVVLDHSISEALITMFISQYPAISKAFDNVVPALSCNNWTTPYYETNISYPAFSQYVSGSREDDYNATVSPNLSGGKLLFGNVTDEEAVPAPAAASNKTTSTSPSASAKASGNSTTNAKNNIQQDPAGSASRAIVASFSSLLLVAVALALVV